MKTQNHLPDMLVGLAFVPGPLVLTFCDLWVAERFQVLPPFVVVSNILLLVPLYIFIRYLGIE